MNIAQPPTTLFIELTTECNSRCRYCHMWTLTDADDSLTTDERRAVIAAFALLNPHGEVVFTGGETMRKLGEFLALTGQCRDLGLRSAANTNGSYISPENYERVLLEGPTFLVFSLDSHLASVHDFNRGLSGSLRETTATIQGLLRMRDELARDGASEVVTNSVLLDGNIASLFEFLEFLGTLGVDGATFQILSPTFYRRSEVDSFYQQHFFKDKPLAVDTLQRLIERLEEFPFVRTTAADLRWMQRYILFPAELEEGVCGSHERNMMVDHRGDVQLCFNMRKIFHGDVVGNVRVTHLEDLWIGDKASAARDIMSRCRLTCGMLNCHRKPT